MAFSRVGVLRSALRFSPSPPAVAAVGFSAAEFGSQLRNQFPTRDLQSSAWRDSGVVSWMTTNMASQVGTRLLPNMGSTGVNSQANTSLTAAVAKLLSVSSRGGQHSYPFAASGALNTAGNPGAGSQQVRTIMVEVKRNDLDRAIRRWRRKCKEENLRSLKDREYYIKPSEKRVLARKERDHRIAKRAFKQKLNWIMGRRQRGF